MKNQGMDDYRTMQTNPFGRVPAKKDEIRLKEAGGVELQGETNRWTAAAGRCLS